MRPFKFFRTPLLTTHDGGDVYCGEIFYSMGIRPSLRHKLQRLDISKDFEPDNCVWYIKG